MVAPLFIIVSGLPGSGKSTLARHLQSAVHLPLLDKDTILEELFDAEEFGPGRVADAERRRALSRKSDRVLQDRATASGGAILVSHWHLPGMPPGSGTPAEWLTQLSGRIIHVRCVCSPEIAAQRFFERIRHPGHLDGGRTHAEILASIRENARFGQLEIGLNVIVDVSQTPDYEAAIREVLAARAKLTFM